MNHNSLSDWLATTETRCLPSTPFVIIMCGLSGSGKSTVSRFLAQHYQAAWIRSDIERKWLFGLTARQSSQSLHEDIYSREATQQTFQRMLSLTQQLLNKHYPVIVDSCALKACERDLFRGTGQQYNIPAITLFCEASRDTLIKRIHARQKKNSDPSEASPDLIHQQQSWLEMPSAIETKALIKLDTESRHWRKTLLVALKYSALHPSNNGEGG